MLVSLVHMSARITAKQLKDEGRFAGIAHRLGTIMIHCLMLPQSMQMLTSISNPCVSATIPRPEARTGSLAEFRFDN